MAVYTAYCAFGTGIARLLSTARRRLAFNFAGAASISSARSVCRGCGSSGHELPHLRQPARLAACKRGRNTVIKRKQRIPMRDLSTMAAEDRTTVEKKP